MKRKTTTQPEEFHDLLVPILLVLCVLPLLLRLFVYDCGYADYGWYFDDGTRADFYSFIKSRFFIVIAIFLAIILGFRLLLYSEKTKPWKIFLPLGGYAVFAWLSAILSKNGYAAFRGNLDSFESIFVLTGYVLLCFYVYQAMDTERDYRIIWGGILFIFSVMSLIGLLQILGVDLMNFPWVQKLIMSGEEYSIYGGTVQNTFTDNRVSLTLYNPNYAGVYLGMLSSVIAAMAFTESDRRKKTVYLLLTVLSLVLVWFTYSRGALLATAAAYLVCLYLVGRQHKAPAFLHIAAAAAALIAGLVVVDLLLGSPFLSRIIDKGDIEPLERLVTTADGVEITYADQSFLITIDGGKIVIQDSDGKVLDKLKGAQKYALPVDDQVLVGFSEGGYGPEIRLTAADCMMDFVRTDDGYFYLTPGDNSLETIGDIPAVDFHGLEHLGSGRLYIWSRTIPLLKKYLLFGSGPDTFAESFPQNDYAGKILYSNNPGRIIEKGHNDYLTKWVQTGLLSLLCALAFYILLLKREAASYGAGMPNTVRARLGLGCYAACVCYMTASLFSDSTIQTSPLFWTLAGITLSAAHQTASADGSASSGRGK